MFVSDGVISGALDDAPVAGHDAVHWLIPDLVKTTHQDYICRCWVFGVNLGEGPLQVPHLGSRDALHIHVEDGFDIEVGDAVVESAAAQHNLPPPVLNLHSVNVLARGAEVGRLVVCDTVSPVHFTGKVKMSVH